MIGRVPTDRVSTSVGELLDAVLVEKYPEPSEEEFIMLAEVIGVSKEMIENLYDTWKESLKQQK